MSRSRPRLLRRLRRREGFANFELRVAARVAWVLVGVLRWTTRLRVEGDDSLLKHWEAAHAGKPTRPVILAFWHGRGILLPLFYRGVGATIMNSAHRDGEIVTRALALLGIEATRGSGSRGGVGGLLGLVRAGRQGRDLALIPDGPRGPAGKAKAGVAELALTMGAVVIPVSMSAKAFFRATSWDRLMIPRPGTEVIVVVGKPIAPGPRLRGEKAREQREALRQQIETEISLATRAADRAAGREEEDA